MIKNFKSETSFLWDFHICKRVYAKKMNHFCAHEFFMFTVMSQNTYNLYSINAALSEYEA